MTKDEILAMEAGEELDAYVLHYIHGIDKWGIWVEENGSPSTDISAAWQVVEKMLSQGFSFSLQKQIITGGEPAWECCFFEGPPASPVGGIKTAPEAICKAALLAKLEARS